MALTAQLNAATRAAYVPGYFDQIELGCPFLDWLLKNAEGLDGGTDVRLKARYQRALSGGSYSGDDVLNIAKREELTDAIFDWKYLYFAASIDQTDLTRNQGEARLANLIELKIKFLKSNQRDMMATQVHSDGTGNSSKDLNGAKNLIDDGTNYEASTNITPRSLYTWWQAQYANLSSTDITLRRIEFFFNQCTKNGKTPDYGGTTRAILSAIWALLQPSQRYYDEGLRKVGYKNLIWDGITPIIRDDYQASGTLIFANKDAIGLKYINGRKFKLGEWEKPIDQEVRTIKLFFDGELCVWEPRLCGKMIGITEPTISTI